MRTHHHKGAQGTFKQQHPTTLYKCILHVMYKSLYHQICLKDFFPPPTRSDAFLSFLTATIRVLKALYNKQPRNNTYQQYNNQFYLIVLSMYIF